MLTHVVLHTRPTPTLAASYLGGGRLGLFPGPVIWCGSSPLAVRLLVSKSGHGIFNVHTDLSV